MNFKSRSWAGRALTVVAIAFFAVVVVNAQNESIEIAHEGLFIDDDD
jgi:hypothetical protein